MQKCRLFIVLAVLVFGGLFFLTSYGIGRCDEPIRLGFVGPLSGELSSYGISSLRGVELAIEEANMARHTGEFIGWSTLTGRDFFSASAKCLEPTSLLKFERDRFLRILETNSDNAAILFKRLAKTLGKRLIETYPTTV